MHAHFCGVFDFSCTYLHSATAELRTPLFVVLFGLWDGRFFAVNLRLKLMASHHTGLRGFRLTLDCDVFGFD